jgi:hypothetical protein
VRLRFVLTADTAAELLPQVQAAPGSVSPGDKYVRRAVRLGPFIVADLASFPAVAIAHWLSQMATWMMSGCEMCVFARSEMNNA